MSIWHISILGFICILAGYLIAVSRDSKQDVSFLDLVAHNGKLSTSKILQVVGGVCATWIVIKLTLTTGINWDIFAIYLAYVAGVDGFNKVIQAKFSNKDSNNYSHQQPYRPQNFSRNNENYEERGAAKTPEE